MSALLKAWAHTLRRFGDRPAVSDAASGTTLTFAELDRRAEAWRARHLAGEKTWQGAKVVFAVGNSPAWLELFLALMKAGATAVPLDAAEPAAAQEAMATRLGAARWNGHAFTTPNPRRRAGSDTLALIKLTSGSTGTPKAFAFTADEMLADARQVCATMGITPRDLNYALIPFGHSYGLGNLTIPLIALGIPLVIATSPLPHAIAADFVRWRPTVFPGVPALWRALAASRVAVASLRLGISAGAPLPPAVAAEFAAATGCALHNFYGASETGGIAFDRTGKATRAGGVGRPLRGVTLRFLSASRLEVSSAAVFTHGNRRRRGRIGAHVAADQVQPDAHGGLTLLGRRGQTVKIAGRRVHLGEVSARLRRVPGVSEAWVGLSAGTESTLSAVVATTLSAAALRTALHADTAAWKIPKKLVTVAALPLTARGKPDLPALRALIA